jgi:SAM-dependent methyltransferase
MERFLYYRGEEYHRRQIQRQNKKGAVMDAKMALKRFYQEVGEKYPEEDEVYRTLRGRLRRQFVMNRLGNLSGPLLDVGCNRGAYLAGYLHGPRFGVDLSLPVLKRIEPESAIRRVQADAERLFCFKPGSFENVLCSEVLEHCLHPDRVMAGIAHVLKNGGQALITTPNYHGLRPSWIELGSLEHYGVHSELAEGYYHTAFKPEELAGLAKTAGLAVCEQGTLEREIKYAAKLPAVFLYLGFYGRRWLGWHALDTICEKLFNRFSLMIYRFFQFSGLEGFLLKRIREGVRTYVVVKKN